MNNNFKPFIALPNSAKLNKKLQFYNINKELFNNIIQQKDKTIVENSINSINSINSVNLMNKDIPDRKLFINSSDCVSDIKENTGLLAGENQCKYCCYDIDSNVNFFKNIFLSNTINFDKK